MLPLGIDPVVLTRTVRPGAWSVVRPIAEARRAEALIRAFVPDYVSRLPREWPARGPSLVELLAADPINHWWFLEITEKSPFRGRWISQLYALALVRFFVEAGGLREAEEVWLDVDDARLSRLFEAEFRPRLQVRVVPSLRRIWERLRRHLTSAIVLRYLINAWGTWTLHALRVLTLRLVGLHRQPVSEDAVAFFSFYPAWWSHAYDRAATEWFFEDLPRRVAAHVPVRFLLWYSGSLPAALKYRGAMRSLVQTHGAAFLQSAIGVLGAGHILNPRHLIRVLRFRRVAGHQGSTPFAGFDIGSIVRDEILRSMTSPEFFLDLLLCTSIEKVARTGALKALVYRLEFQPFERAILAGTRGLVPTIAVQHSTFGRNYLPYYFPREDLRGGGVPAMPLPEIIATAGPAGRDVMLSNGFPPHRVHVVGPIRYNRLLRQRSGSPRTDARTALRVPQGARAFLVTTSVVRAESLALLAALGEAIQMLSVKPHVLFKSHPAMPLDDVFAEWVGPTLQSGRYRALRADEPIYDVLLAADGVILTGSTVAIEAMLFDVMPIVFESRILFDAKSMHNLENACPRVSTPEELAEAMRQVLDGDPPAGTARDNWNSVITAAFGPLDADPHERFLNMLEQYGLLQ